MRKFTVLMGFVLGFGALAGGAARAEVTAGEADDACGGDCASAITARAGGEGAQAGRTSCEIQRGESPEDWIVRIKHRRGASGPETSPCEIVPPRDAATTKRDAAPRGPDGPAPRAPAQPR